MHMTKTVNTVPLIYSSVNKQKHLCFFSNLVLNYTVSTLPRTFLTFNNTGNTSGATVNRRKKKCLLEKVKKPQINSCVNY